jgi:hypothetical protein
MRVQGDGFHVSISVLLPDGRAWVDRYVLQEPNLFAAKRAVDRFYGGGKFLDGTDWLDVAVCESEIAGIRRDGSLWVSEKPERYPYRVVPLVRMGNGNDWKSARTFGGTVVFLLKNDGTLWWWGAPQGGGTKEWPGLRDFTPEQVGKDADWVEIFSAFGAAAFRKGNGEVWTHGGWRGDLRGIVLEHNPVFESHRWKNTLVSWAQLGTFLAGVSDDGTFRELGVLQKRGIKKSRYSDAEWVSRDAQIGAGTDWMKAISLRAFRNKIFSLKADGTLWLWQYSLIHGDKTLYEIDGRRFSSTRFSEHSDWVGIDAGDEWYDVLDRGFVSLAADGGLWLWRFEPDWYFPSGSSSSLHPLMRQSRRPQFLGNIFGSAASLNIKK